MKQPTEYEAFTNLVDHLLSVPREEMQRRLNEARKASDANPRKRGPKKRTAAKPSASGYPAR